MTKQIKTGETMKRLSKKVFACGMLAITMTASGAVRAGPNISQQQHWVVYGGPSQGWDTELRGTVMYIVGSDLFVSPDQEYEHLMVAGNKIKPGPDDIDPGYYSFPGIQTAYRPMMKLETYPVQLRGDGNPGGGPIMVHVPDSVSRCGSTNGLCPIAINDHISVRGPG